jgi:hypothetical protein
MVAKVSLTQSFSVIYTLSICSALQVATLKLVRSISSVKEVLGNVKLSDTGTLAAEEAGSALRRVIEPVPDIRVISNDLLLSYGNSLFFESQAKYVNIHFNLGYNTFVQDKFTALNSQLRFSYLFH